MKNKRIINALIALVAAILVSPLAAFAQGPGNQQDLAIDAAMRTAVIEGALKNLNDYYVFPEVAKKMDQAIRERLGRKEYDQITSASTLSQKLTEHLQEVSRDKHLRVGYSAEVIPVPTGNGGPTPEERERFQGYLRTINFGFEKIER